MSTVASLLGSGQPLDIYCVCGSGGMGYLFPWGCSTIWMISCSSVLQGLQKCLLLLRRLQGCLLAPVSLWPLIKLKGHPLQ